MILKENLIGKPNKNLFKGKNIEIDYLCPNAQTSSIILTQSYYQNYRKKKKINIIIRRKLNPIKKGIEEQNRKTWYYI